MSAFDGLLEPKAVEAGEVDPKVLMSDVAGLSLAISAKRQADAAERIAAALETLAHPEWGVAPAIRSAARS